MSCGVPRHSIICSRGMGGRLQQKFNDFFEEYKECYCAFTNQQAVHCGTNSVHIAVLLVGAISQTHRILQIAF